MQKSLLSSILISGFIVGTADIVVAFINAYAKSGISPDIVLKFIASGFFGKEAFKGGIEMVLTGLLFHFFIAYVFTIIFYLLYPKIKWMSKHKIFTGIVYGLFVWAVMNLLVLPLSQVSQTPFSFVRAIEAMLILIIAIGLPLSYLTHRFYDKKQE